MFDLQRHDFIDASTRAIIVDVSLFHAPTSVLTSLAILFEFPVIGGVRAQVRVASATMYRYVTAFDNFVLACEVSEANCDSLFCSVSSSPLLAAALHRHNPREAV